MGMPLQLECERGGRIAAGALEVAIALTPEERASIVECFFYAYPGRGSASVGLGRAILDFQAWEVASGRIVDRGGSPWWRAVNGAMVLDMAAAMNGTRGPTGTRAWQRYACEHGSSQASLWEAHQRSLHRAIDACHALLEREAAPERTFAGIVIDVVDRTALASRPTDSSELAALVERFYPRVYPIGKDDLASVERMQTRTAEALRGPGDKVFDDVGIGSQRWR